MLTESNIKIAIIGQGYVGLPLAVEFGKHYPTLGFDIQQQRVNELKKGHDSTLEVSDEEIASSKQLDFSADVNELKHYNVFIVTVPTPIDEAKKPDLTPLRKASEMLGKVIQAGDVVIYESTVYPGTTEEECLPIIEKESGLTFNEDFFAGYSPERINPGDKERRVHNIVKITSGSTPEISDFVDNLYNKIVTVGTHKASSIKVAEAAKVIENTQRDLNIALVNELAIIFNKLGIDTLEVLEAAGSKWNFLPFRPGLVGGHCISVDPYYLTHKAQQSGYHPDVILAGRKINDDMGRYISDQVIHLMMRKRLHVVDSNILILGFTFKENCPDLRNTRVIDIVNCLQAYHAQVDIYDPWANAAEAKEEYDINLISEPKKNHYDAVIICVAHDEFRDMGEQGIKAFAKEQHIIYDVKHTLPKDSVDARL